MDHFVVEATNRTPAIKLDVTACTLGIEGESYPEDVRSFYSVLSENLATFIGSKPDGLTVNIKLTYFNSSSARMLMELLDQLDDAAGSGIAINVNWYCDPDDDITREFAEDIASEVNNAVVKILDLDAEQD